MKLNSKIQLFSVFIMLANSAYSADYLSPNAIAKGKAEKKLYITSSTAKSVMFFDVGSKKVEKTIALEENPSDISISKNGKKLYVTTNSPQGKIVVLSTDGIIEKTISVGHTPMSPIESNDGKTLYVCNRFSNTVSFIDLASGKETANIAVLREPVASVLSKDGKKLFVANLLPAGSADGDYIASYISIINTDSKKVVDEIRLLNGSMALRGICISPDGKYIYSTHILARYQLPTTQLERGWMNTNAMSIVSVKDNKLLATVLLDEIDRGAANPWGIKCSDDGKYIIVAHAGTHEISVIEQAKLHEKLNIKPTKKRKRKKKKTNYGSDPSNNLAFLVDVRTRIQLNGNGPKGLTIIGNKAYVTEYFTGSLGIIEIDKGENGKIDSIKLGKEIKLSEVRKGEILFNDATICFQSWQSCATCHPDIRNDGLNWDLLNDGMGNPKSTKSMLLAHETPPVMITGIRAKAEVAVRAGLKFAHFAVRPESDAEAIDEFLKSLKPVESPYLVNKKLTKSAKQGKKIFKKAGCASCHSGSMFTDLQKYDLKSAKGVDKGKKFDTPTLIEVWRTGPYLYDGRAATIMEVLTKYNKDNNHGYTSNLSKEELKDLEQYILSQ